jgi:hypothetical protein
MTSPMAIEISSVEEVLDRAQFHRRMGCPRSDDVSELKDALREALASNDRLRERVADLEEMPDALKTAELALRCGLKSDERARGDECALGDIDDCAACAAASIERLHATEVAELRGKLEAALRPTLIHGGVGGDDDEIQSLREELALVLADRDRLLVETQQPAPLRRTRRPKQVIDGQVSLIDAFIQPMIDTKASPAEPKPRAKRQRKRRLWLDAKPAAVNAKGASPTRTK